MTDLKSRDEISKHSQLEYRIEWASSEKKMRINARGHKLWRAGDEQRRIRKRRAKIKSERASLVEMCQQSSE